MGEFWFAPNLGEGDRQTGLVGYRELYGFTWGKNELKSRFLPGFDSRLRDVSKSAGRHKDLTGKHVLEVRLTRLIGFQKQDFLPRSPGKRSANLHFHIWQ